MQAATRKGEKSGKLSFANMMYNCFFSLGHTEELAGLATHWFHSHIGEQKQMGVFGSKK